MITIVKTPQFEGKAAKVMSAMEKDELIGFIARSPRDGDIIPNTGGVRKLRFAIQGKGKRGGVRVIYYYHNDRNPVLLFTVFSKNEKTDLTKKEKNIRYRIVQEIKKEMKS